MSELANKSVLPCSHPSDKSPVGTESCHLGRRVQQGSDSVCINEMVPALTHAPLRPDHAG